MTGMYLGDSDSRTRSTLVPLLPASVSIAAHVCYYRLLLGRNFPIIPKALSPSALLCFGITLLAHFLWFHHFVQRQKQEYIQFYQNSYRSNTATTPPLIASAWALLGFFTVFVWLVPLGLFVSVTLQDDCLPETIGHNAASYHYTSNSSSTSFPVDTRFNSSLTASHVVQRRGSYYPGGTTTATTTSNTNGNSLSQQNPYEGSHDRMIDSSMDYTQTYSSKSKGMLMKQLLDRWWTRGNPSIPTKTKKIQDEKRFV
jgi:hypothetical protein